MCAQRDVCRGRPRFNQITCESMLHMEGGTSPVCHRVFVVGVDPVHIWKECLQGRTVINPGCSRTKQLSRGSAGEVRKDGIRGRDHNERKECLYKRGPHPG